MVPRRRNHGLPIRAMGMATDDSPGVVKTLELWSVGLVRSITPA